MADKVTIDFENGIIEWDLPQQQGQEICCDLADRKNTILEAIGCETIDIGLLVDQINRMLAGEISPEEFQWWSEEWVREDENKRKYEQKNLEKEVLCLRQETKKQEKIIDFLTSVVSRQLGIAQK